jgi:hypothetical protein
MKYDRRHKADEGSDGIVVEPHHQGDEKGYRRPKQ